MKLGEWYKDVVTGDYGVLVRLVEHISGCTRATLSTPTKGKGTSMTSIEIIRLEEFDINTANDKEAKAFLASDAMKDYSRFAKKFEYLFHIGDEIECLTKGNEKGVIIGIETELFGANPTYLVRLSTPKDTDNNTIWLDGKELKMSERNKIKILDEVKKEKKKEEGVKKTARRTRI